MKITRVEYVVKKIRLTEPYTIAYETISSCENGFMVMETDSGIIGWGCAAPDKMVTGETAETVSRAFAGIMEPVLKGNDPLRYTYLLEEIKKKLGNQPSALAMVDMALHDLISRKAGLPLYKFLGGYRENIPTSITIGILPLKETLEKAKEFLSQGFYILKIKGGSNLEEDIEKIRKIRETGGDGIEIRFDANQGYTVDQALSFVDKTRASRVELLEQPTTKEDENLLGKVSRQSTIPIMADESLMSLKDIFRLASNELSDMINIKLMKVGGINEALHINSVAKSAGLESMTGCMDESALSISAGLHFTLSRPNIVYADLDGHLDLVDDPFQGMVTIQKGIMYPSETPGIGDVKGKKLRML